MPLEFSVKRPDGTELGSADFLRGEVARALPGVQFERSPDGRAYVEAMEARGRKLPDSLRETMLQRPGTERAIAEGDGFSAVIYGFLTEPIVVLHIEIRGEGNPLPFFRSLCQPHGWTVVQDATDQTVPL